MGHYGFGETGDYVLGNIPVIRHNSEPCIVCGHPTGDCATLTSAPLHIWGTVEVPSLEDSTMILVEEDVVEWRQITPFTKSKVLLARRGQQIPVTRARELGIV